MDSSPVNFLRRCIEYYSPSGSEAELAKFIGNFLKDCDFKVNFDSVGNVIAEKGEGKPTILFSSHLDTIPGKLPVIEKKGKIYGRGAVDCKSSLASMIYTLANYDFQNIKAGKVIFCGIVREEDSLIGIDELLKADLSPDYAVFGEPTNINQICKAYKGRLCISFKVSSKTGHVASSWEYVNAVEITLEIWNLIKVICWQLNKKLINSNPKTEYFDKIVPNLTTISGGNLSNCVPSHCTIQIDIRFPPKISSSFLLNQIRKDILSFQIAYERENNKKFKIQEKISSLIDGLETDYRNLLINALRWAIFNSTGKKPKLIKKTGTTFINKIGLSYNIPSITWGPGNPRLEHTDEEFIEVEEFLKSIKIFNKFIMKFFQLYQKKMDK